MNALLAAKNLSFQYGERLILTGVSLAVEAGEFVGLIGANGSGKTTLLRILLGIPPSAGEIQLCGDSLEKLDRREIARRVAMVPQDTRIDFAFTAHEVIAMGRTPYLGRFTPESAVDREAIDRAMRDTSVTDLAERPVTELSGGERQRVHLARVLAQQTRVMLLDEPTANLDLTRQFETLEFVRKFTLAGGAALAAFHDLSLAARFCDRLLLLSEGKLVADGAPAEVITETNLAHYFLLRARIRRDDETGGLFVYPLGSIDAGAGRPASIDNS